jgi:hypothetical protein
MWERRCDDSTCSRKRRVSQHMCLLIHRFREQARSHIWIFVMLKMEFCSSDLEPAMFLQVIIDLRRRNLLQAAQQFV